MVEIVSEDQLFGILDSTRNAVLVEPSYRRKLMPLGLAKISTYLKKRGVPVKFSRAVPETDADTIFVTSLFTYSWKETKSALLAATSTGKRVVLGGVAATLIKERVIKEIPGDVSLYLGYSQMLDAQPTDYTTNWYLKDPWDKYSMVFTSRGCANKCAYCAVKVLEREPWVNKDWKNSIASHLPLILVFDNNLSSTPREHCDDVLDTLIGLGKPVMFENGFDVKHIDEHVAKKLGRIKYVESGMRVAFDRIAEDGLFQERVELLKSFGVPKSRVLAYVLFNFNDTPKDADYRARACHDLGIRPYPQMFELLNATERHTYVGKYWTKNLAKQFRYFWLMGGLFRKMTFEEYCKRDKVLTPEDWKKWIDSPVAVASQQ